jgi:SpoVK/Ycf46/Vps4 family AAA+-type ATPase
LLRQCRDSLSGLGVDADPEAAADALRGLGLREAKDAILVDFVNHDDVAVERLAAYKAQELTKVPGVRFVGDVESIDDVGGLEVLVSDLAVFQGSLTQDALEFGCDEPRGFMVCGVPGCGKTLFGSAASNMLGLPLVIFNPSECEGGIVGETGDRMRAALQTIDAVSPCVVLIDEGEKAFGSGGERDSGSKQTLRREFLMWSNDRKSRVFVIMTCNDATAMPPEMKRAKRWDETYFVDLPHAEERRAIIRVHLRRRKRELPDSDIDALVEATDGFTGAELEAGIAKAVRVCYTEDKRELRPQDVAAQYERIVPQSKGEQIKALRAWAKEANAIAASKPAPRSRTRRSKRGTAEPKKPSKLVN